MPAAALLRRGAAQRPPPGEALAARLHVCFVAPYAWPALARDPRVKALGGAEVQQAVLARLFAARGWRVSMICLDFGQPERCTVDGVEVLRAFGTHEGLPGLRFLHPRLTTMWRRLAVVDADVYYYRSSSMWVGVLAAFCRRHGKRLVYAAASDKDFAPDLGGMVRYRRDRWLYERGVRAADAIIAQNAGQVAGCRRRFGREAVLIPSAYELPGKRAPAAERDCVLWVAMLQPGKRPEMLLDIARRLPQRRFVLVGGARPENEALAEELRAAAARLPNVHMTGFLPLAEAEAWFDRARVVVNTSTFEGMPNTFLQAWARGVPTVATVDAGAPVHRVFATAEQGAAEIERHFADPAWHAAAARRCREYFERVHSSEAVLRRYAEVFERLCR